jgi:hypothetical protein
MQQSAKDHSGETTKQWISAMSNLVTCSVYYSFKFDKKKTEQLPILIMSKIKETTGFLTSTGQDPVHAEWFEKNVLSHLNNKAWMKTQIGKMYSASAHKIVNIFTIPQDFITFFTVAHAFHMQNNQNVNVMSLSAYDEEARQTDIGEIVNKFLTNDKLSEFRKCREKSTISFLEPSRDEKDCIIQAVQKFKGLQIESLINTMRVSGDNYMKKKLKNLPKKLEW